MMIQKNTAPGVLMLLGEMDITLMASNDGIALNASVRLVGVIPKSEKPTNRSGLGAGLSKVSQSGSWLVRAVTVPRNFIEL
jgi:hypothetical protein